MCKKITLLKWGAGNFNAVFLKSNKMTVTTVFSQDDKWLENFLTGCKLSIEKCKAVLNNFYTSRTLLPQLFLNGDATSQDIREISQIYYHILLPTNTPESYAIVMYGLLDMDVSKYDVGTMLKRELLLCNTHLYIGSHFAFTIVYDCHGFSMQHLSKLAPYLRELLYSCQDTMPFRFKQIHFVYATPILQKVLSMIAPLLKAKLRNRIHVHTDDLSTLYKFIPQELLPNEYGGRAGTIKQLNEDYQRRIESMKDVLIKEYKKKTDESKRTKDCMHNELFGLDGTFKSLNVD